MDIVIIISLVTLVSTFLVFMINIRKEISKSYEEARNALSEQINILKEKNEILDRLTYKNYLEDITAMKEIYEMKNSITKEQKETKDTSTELTPLRDKIYPVEEISKKIEALTRDIILQLDSKINSSLKIVSPKESEAYEEWVKVSGAGAPANYKIFLFTWLGSKFSSLQKDISTTDSNGNWYNQECQLYNVGGYREIYAIAVESEKEIMAFELYKNCGKRINPIIFQSVLEKSGIKSVVSKGKKLIRLD